MPLQRIIRHTVGQQLLFRNCCLKLSATTGQQQPSRSHNSRAIKKRILRVPSDTVVHQEEVDDGQHGPNDSVPLKLVNRNPRNLEQMGFERKPLGWELETPTRTFWNKVEFEKSGKHLMAKVVHHTGRTLVSASTAEPAYREQCDSLTDITAARNVAVILARRCLEAGILYVHKPNELSGDKESQKVAVFLETLAAEGLSLKEPDMIFPRRMRDL